MWKDFKYERSDGYCDEDCVFSSGQESAEKASRAHLEENDAEHTDLLLHSGVRWLSRGTFLARFTERLPEIKDFLKLSKHVDYHTKLEDHQWLLDLSFLTDLTGELNELNLELQGKDKDVVNMMSSVNTFKSKLQLMSSRLQCGKLPSHASRTTTSR